jgi:hypothetical protein
MTYAQRFSKGDVTSPSQLHQPLESGRVAMAE